MDREAEYRKLVEDIVQAGWRDNPQHLDDARAKLDALVLPALRDSQRLDGACGWRSGFPACEREPKGEWRFCPYCGKKVQVLTPNATEVDDV